MDQANELRVICAGGFRAAMEKIAPLFEQASGCKMALTFGTPAATREAAIKATGFDAAVVTSTSLNAEARAELRETFVVAKSPVGIGFSPQAGARPVSSLEEFIAAVRSLQSIGFSDPKAGTNLGADIIAAADKLGFGDDLRARAQFVIGPGSVVSAHVARNEYEAVMTLVSEIITVPGVVYGGPVPDAMGLGTPFEAGIAKRAQMSDAAADLLAFLRREESRALMRSTGLVVFG